MSEKRRPYTEACKLAAVRLVTDQGYGVTAAARNLGINAKMLGRWTRQAERHTNGSRGGNGHLRAEHEELVQWRKEVKRLRREREIVKQAALFFANESR
jgi:transposase